MRIRSTTVRLWRASLNRDYLYGSQGKGAQRAAWLQAAHAELSSMRRRCYGVVLVDLVKAFERVPHLKVLEAARRWGYPMWVLRLSLDAYRMTRVLSIDGACSRVVQAARGLTAGSGFATEELCCLMLNVLDEVRHEIPSAPAALYVDDAAVERAEADVTVANNLVKAADILAKGVDDVGLQLSDTKSVVLSNVVKVALFVAKKATVRGEPFLQVKRWTKDLG